MKVLVFDLDDTLYEELTYVRSGFLAVADFVEQQLGINSKEAFDLMWKALGQGRGHIFDEMLRHFNGYSKKHVHQCVQAYRTHTPEITLDPAAERCLERFKDYPVYIVTDGNKMVQHNKLRALCLYERIQFCFVTHRYGIKHAKPSPYCFEKIAKWEEVKPEEIVYIGDNPAKDFIGIKALGFRTVRIMQGNHKDVEKEEKYEAHVRISSLDELTSNLLDQLRTL
ncbi:HAD-IA family hydrolase [Paenibacillus sp. LMG 31461]|uniref:HAD-IA family hydrolase n=1 Tax=Paenibacillus plantarum TaxID=2654975 RepID=A0ABX1XE27_9BACL|nr:HAD-IA family hydrolase [Paenibacillus plantarum]NOU66732.1 HAD-IA family hydrolase [Paenibacillus plantarum]